MPSPEALAREKIDKLLTDCGWILQNRSTINLSAGRGIAGDFYLLLSPLHFQSAIQRRYSMLRGEEIDSEIDERSGYKLRESLWKQPPPVVYNPKVLIE